MRKGEIVIPRYKDIKNEIEQKEDEIMMLKNQMRKLCPHTHIKMDSYCNDDWAQNKKYTVTYKCEYCGKYASYDEENNKPKNMDFMFLERKYQKAKDKEFKKKYRRKSD